MFDEREVWRHYHDGLEALVERRLDDAARYFRAALRLQPDFPGAYEGLAAAARKQGRKAEEKQCTTVAFEKVRALYPRWPRRLSWSDIENRPVLRIIQMRAVVHHEEGNHAEVERLYRLLLRLNPSDNGGVRYLLSRLCKGIPPD